MKLAKVVENILAEDSGAPLHERIAKLEKEWGVLWLALDHSTEDYELVVAGSRKLCSEHDQLKIHCDNMQAELVQAHSNAEKHISDLEAKVASTEAHNIKIAAEGKKSLRDFSSSECTICMLREFKASEVCVWQCQWGEPSVEDYLNWLFEEVSSLPDVFSGINENLATAAIEGALTLADDSIDLEAVRTGASKAGTNILPDASGVQKVAWVISKKWWRLFGYDYVLSTIGTQQAKTKVLSDFWVLVCFRLLTLIIDLFYVVATSQEANVEAPIETTLVGDVALVVDARIAKISVEKCPKSGGFASARGYDDADEGWEEV
jgi:hypothetical protein